MENDKRKAGQKKGERHNTEMARDKTQRYCEAGKMGVVFLWTSVPS